MTVQVVLVHGIRTSATMWRAQIEHLRASGIGVHAFDLPGHGSRMDEPFTLERARARIDSAIADAAALGPVLLVGHSMGGLLSVDAMGREPARSAVRAFVAASCTAFPRGAGLAIYRALAGTFNALPDQGMWFTRRVLHATLPEETRDDFGAGGYALAAQDTALQSLSALQLAGVLPGIEVPTWFVNGQFDQLRLHEQRFLSLTPDAELLVVPRTSHLLPVMRPRVFSALLDLAIATIAARVHSSRVNDVEVS